MRAKRKGVFDKGMSSRTGSSWRRTSTALGSGSSAKARVSGLNIRSTKKCSSFIHLLSARSQLYRGRSLQVNTSLPFSEFFEIYNMCIFFTAQISAIYQNFVRIVGDCFGVNFVKIGIPHQFRLHTSTAKFRLHTSSTS